MLPMQSPTDIEPVGVGELVGDVPGVGLLDRRPSQTVLRRRRLHA